MRFILFNTRKYLVNLIQVQMNCVELHLLYYRYIFIFINAILLLTLVWNFTYNYIVRTYLDLTREPVEQAPKAAAD